MLDTEDSKQVIDRQAAETGLRQSNPDLHRRFFGPGPKRILSLDGGGVLGVIEIAFLERIEALLRGRTGDPDLVLSDYFDLIGGTSTGSIIATALALGMTMRQVKDLYFDFAEGIFQRPLLSVPGIHPRFDARALANKLRGVLGDRQFQSDDVRTGLAVVTKRVDTGSAWVIFNHPCSKHWEDSHEPGPDGGHTVIGNKRYLLWHVVRASTAAPFFFNPKSLKLLDRKEGECFGVFVDGALSTYNNPSLLLFMLATMKGYGVHWPSGAEKILVISVGSGAQRPRIDPSAARRLFSGHLGIKTLRSIIWDSQIGTLKMMQWLSTPVRPWHINSEVGDLSEDLLPAGMGKPGGHLSFQRYDVGLDPDWLATELGERHERETLEKLADFMQPRIMPQAYELARKVANRHVEQSHFPVGFDPVT